MNINIINIADTHFTFTPPKCRDPEEFLRSQDKKIDWLLEQQEKYEAIIAISGDVCEWNAPRELIAYLITRFKKTRSHSHIIVIPGQHDLPNHNIKEYHRSALNVLEASGIFRVLKNPKRPFTFRNAKIYGIPWLGKGVIPKDDDYFKMVLLHEGVYHGKKPFPNCKWRTAVKVLKQHSWADFVFSGDNHKQFDYKNLINCGSFIRLKADQKDHQPYIYVTNTKTKKVKRIPVPINKKAISREHIEVEEDRDKRIEDFVDHLRHKYDIGISFEDNMDSFLETNRIRKGTKSWIRRALQCHLD